MYDGRVTRGVLVIVSSPSGAGKTTLTRRLLREHAENLEFSVSYTTRPMRPGELDGRDYHFVTPEKFEEMVRNREFAEHAFVHRNRYGTAESAVEAALSNGKDMIFDVDWQGGQALSTRWPNDSLKIFILPPDLDTLANRLRTRATDDPKVIAERLANALGELEHFNEYPHVIVNDDLERAYAVLRAIYLTRKYGDVDRADVPFPLAEMAKLVKANDEAKAHAGRLLGR